MRPQKKIANNAGAATTWPGFENPHGQIVVRATGQASESFAGQKIYHLRCKQCQANYGANGCDLHLRRCPACQQGTPGEPLRPSGTLPLFS